MKLRIEFGIEGGDSATVYWWNALTDFPHIVSHKGNNWHWLTYNESDDNYWDQVLIFGKIPYYDPNFGVDAPTLDEIKQGYGFKKSKCECGASRVRGLENCHSFWCPKYKG